MDVLSSMVGLITRHFEKEKAKNRKDGAKKAAKSRKQKNKLVQHQEC